MRAECDLRSREGGMKFCFQTAARAATALLVSVTAVQAAEIKILSSNGVTAVMKELGPEFERASGHRIAIHFDAAALLRKKVEAGEAFDLTILTAPVLEDVMKKGLVVAGSRADIARSGVGVAMRAGQPKPDIGNTEAFKRTMLAAQTVAYTTEGTSGRYFVSLLERLGIGEQMKPKARTRQSGPAAELVAKGEAELAVQQISELLPVAGTQFVGPFPPELQVYTTFSAGLGARAAEPDAARALIKFLTAPAAMPVIKSKGMEPPG